MSHWKAILIVFVLVVAPVELRAQANQYELKKSDPSVKKGLQFSAQVEGELFHPTSTISVKLKLENTGKSPVYIHKQLGFGPAGFRLTILDDSHRWVPPNIHAETLPTPVLSKEDLQAIDPGKSIEEKTQIRLLDYEITPGDYTLKIGYVSPVAVDAVPDGLTVLTSADGAFRAKPIRFKVLVPSPN